MNKLDKFLLKDFGMMLVSLILGIAVGFFFKSINPYMHLVVYLAIGAVMTFAVYGSYLILRKPDLEIELERSLLRTADYDARRCIRRTSRPIWPFAAHCQPNAP